MFAESTATQAAREACFIADAERLSPRWGFAPFCGAPDARGHAYRSGHGVPFVAPWVFTVLWRTGRESTRSVFHRAGCILRSIHAPDARGRFLRSAAFNIHNTPFKSLRMLKVFSVYWARTQNVFHHTVGFHRSAAHQTREVTPTVPGTECHLSRREFYPFRSALDAGECACRSAAFFVLWIFAHMECPPSAAWLI